MNYAEFVNELNITMGTGVPDLDHHTLSLASESGELAGKVLKQLYRGQHYANEEYISELGDILFHLQALCNYFNISLLELAQHNQIKLEDRLQRGVVCGDGDNR